MKLFLTFIASAISASLSLAAPAVQGTAARDGVSSNTLSYNFTLTALNTTLPNANSTGAPLVLNTVGATTGEELEQTSIYASWPYNDWPSFGLVGGNLRAFMTDGTWITNATSITVSGYGNSSTDETLNWLTTREPTTYLSTQYSVVDDGAQYPKLAALGRDDLWSLCPFGSQTSIVFNATSSQASCYPVIVYTIAV